ncbi:hypothetical protein EV356DRAFT_533990 [Viridothelium virens]|uniref:Multiple myeloma tumor-associated protein 2-like N-terminal domain-containing protein n=1 Tax=Viridothelium virens TaxID=1048519 RepID=A0A6A6H5E8_VIRVR|nr:hypothetical protein EV356DRAFT_533990 [Viridothelium virens]
MDLLQTVRKEGSRGGRANFKWEDVKNDQHRENYLGHSLMAPVGRWQTGKDLSWYAKSGNEDGAPSAEDIRKEELRRIKEAEEDALNLALGLPVASRNPNLTPMGAKASESDVKRALAESTGQEEFEDQKGIGFGSYNGRVAGTDSAGDILEGEEDGRPPIKEVATRKKNRDRKRRGDGPDRVTERGTLEHIQAHEKRDDIEDSDHDQENGADTGQGVRASLEIVIVESAEITQTIDGEIATGHDPHEETVETTGTKEAEEALCSPDFTRYQGLSANRSLTFPRVTSAGFSVNQTGQCRLRILAPVLPFLNYIDYRGPYWNLTLADIWPDCGDNF